MCACVCVCVCVVGVLVCERECVGVSVGVCIPSYEFRGHDAVELKDDEERCLHQDNDPHVRHAHLW